MFNWKGIISPHRFKHGFFQKLFTSCYVTCYICTMIVSIRYKGLKLLWTNYSPVKLPTVQIKKIRLILTLLNGSVKIDDMIFQALDCIH